SREPTMTDYSWFKLLVRAIGLLLLGIGAPQLLSSIITICSRFLGGELQWQIMAPMYVGLVAEGAAQMGFGLYLLLGPENLIARCLGGVRGRCAACGYDISTITTGICPECGTEFKASAGAPDVSGPPGPSGRPQR